MHPELATVEQIRRQSRTQPGRALRPLAGLLLALSLASTYTQPENKVGDSCRIPIYNPEGQGLSLESATTYVDGTFVADIRGGLRCIQPGIQN